MNLVFALAIAAREAPHHVPAAAPRAFYPLFHLFMFTMLLAVTTDDVGLMWVAVEGTTLASVFLVNFKQTRASLEASYKYLIVCSVGIAGAVLHIANHALAKSVLFLLSGRIRAAYRSAEIPAVRGLLAAMPVAGAGFLGGMLALMGLPPFGLFVSEVMVFGAGFRGGFAAVAVAGLVFLVVAFGGLLRSLHAILYGVPPAPPAPETKAGTAALVSVVGLALLVLIGLAWPPGLAAALERIAAIVGS